MRQVVVKTFGEMAADMGGAAAEAARLAMKMGSAAVDTVMLMTDLGEELPVINPVLKTLKAVREKVETVKNNREDLVALQERCTYTTACFIVKFRQSPSWATKLRPLEECVETALKFVDRCSRRGKVSRVLRASSVKAELAGLNERVDRLTADLGLSGIATVLGEVAELKGLLVSLPRMCEELLSPLLELQ